MLEEAQTGWGECKGELCKGTGSVAGWVCVGTRKWGGEQGVGGGRGAGARAVVLWCGRDEGACASMSRGVPKSFGVRSCAPRCKSRTALYRILNAPKPDRTRPRRPAAVPHTHRPAPGARAAGLAAGRAYGLNVHLQPTRTCRAKPGTPPGGTSQRTTLRQWRASGGRRGHSGRRPRRGRERSPPAGRRRVPPAAWCGRCGCAVRAAPPPPPPPPPPSLIPISAPTKPY